MSRMCSAVGGDFRDLARRFGVGVSEMLDSDAESASCNCNMSSLGGCVCLRGLLRTGVLALRFVPVVAGVPLDCRECLPPPFVGACSSCVISSAMESFKRTVVVVARGRRLAE